MQWFSALWTVLLGGSPVPFRTPPARFAQSPPPATPESGWSALEQVSLGARLLIEQRDGTRLKGRFHSADDELRSIVMGKGVVATARAAVRRIWLLGRRKAATGALIGLVVGALWGGVLGSIAGAAEDEGAIVALLSAFFYGSLGAGIGAGIGAAIRKQRLIYRDLPTDGPVHWWAVFPLSACGRGNGHEHGR